MNVFLADFDPEVIKNFKIVLKKDLPNMRVAGQTTQPASLKKALFESNAAIAIMDIKFLGNTAYTEIRRLKEERPDIFYILYGSYLDMNFISRLHEFGVSEYLSKPVKPAEFILAVQNVMKAVEKYSAKVTEETNFAQDYEKNLALFRDRFMMNLIYGNLPTESEITGAIRYFKLPIVPEYNVIVVKIDHFRKVVLAYDEKEKHLLAHKIMKILSEQSATVGNSAVIMESFNQFSMIIGGSASSSALIALAKTISSEISMQTPVTVTIGIGNSYMKATEIHVSHKEALASLRYRYYMGFGTVIPISYAEPDNNISYRYPMDKENLLVYTAVTGEYPECENYIRDIFDALSECGDIPPALPSKIIKSILMSIRRYATELKLDIDSEISSVFPHVDIKTLISLPEARVFLSQAIKKICEIMGNQRNIKNRTAIALAKDYIDEHYYETVNVTKIAAAAKVPQEFINKLFLSVSGKNVNDFVMSVRIDIAKKMMQETGLNDEVIAINVGFDDINQFRGVFYQQTGMITHEFRTKSRK